MYKEGDPDSQIIITSGHAGPLKPVTIPRRDVGCWDPDNSICIHRHHCEDKSRKILKSYKHCGVHELGDASTTDMGEVLVDAIRRITGSRPHFIVNRLHRSRLDVNRGIKLGAFGEPEAEQVYLDFHNFIRQAKRSLGNRWGLLLDIHGNNRGNWTMLGYGLLKYQLNEKPLIDAHYSSLRALARRTAISMEVLVRGNRSLGHFMEEAKCQVFPSPDNPSPMNRGYLTGGYITRHHGSKSGGNVDAIQVEIPRLIRDNKELQTPYIAKITQAIVKFIDVNYHMNGKP